MRPLVLVILALTLIAGAARFLNLSMLGFYGDEETTAIASRAIAEEGTPRLRSGMPYRRAVPLMWANAAAAKVFGADRELPYRIPSALLGTLAVPLLFLFARRRLGDAPALLAALLFAVSDWHLSHSREARMYVALLFFFVGAAFAFWEWARSGRWRDLAFACVFVLLAITMHRGAMFLAPVILLPVVFDRWSRVHPVWLFVAAAATVVCTVFYYEWVRAHASEWTIPGVPLHPERTPPVLLPTVLDRVLAAAGALVGLWIAHSGGGRGRLLRTVAFYVGAIVFGAFAFAGQAYAALIGVVIYLLLHPGARRELLRRTWLPAAVCALALAVRVGLGGPKAALTFPYPAPAWMATMFPGVFLLFACTAAYLMLTRPREGDETLRACVLAYILPVAAVGAVARYTPMRYIFPAYPFQLLVAGVGLWAVLQPLARKRPSLAMAAGCVVVLSGVLGGHGLPQAAHVVYLDYGDEVDKLTYSVPFYPDHKTTGEYVRAHRRDGDRIIAEDVLEQVWYAGPVDYWLRDYESHRVFMHVDKEGVIRDNYAGSRPLRDEQLGTLGPGRIWVITSAEERHDRALFLSEAQRRWIENLERTAKPVYTGRDGVSQVFLIE